MAFPRDSQSLASLKFALDLERCRTYGSGHLVHSGRGRISKDMLSSTGILVRTGLLAEAYASLAIWISAIEGPFGFIHEINRLRRTGGWVSFRIL